MRRGLRPGRALGPDHAVARRDGARRAGDGAARARAAAADRRRDDQPPAHRGEDRARVRGATRARARRLARGRRGGEPARPRRSATSSTARTARTRTRLRAVHASKRERPLLSYAEARARRLALEFARRGPRRPRRSSGRRVLDDAAARRRWSPYIDWTFFFSAWELKGQLPEDPRPPDLRARRRASSTTTAQALLRRIIDEKLLRGARRLRLLAGGERRRRPRALRGRSAAAASSRASRCCASSAPRAEGKPRRSASPTSWRRARAALARHVGAFAVTAGIGADELVAALRGASTTTTTRSWSRRSPTGSPRPSPSGCTQRARREWGYGATRALTQRGPDRGEVPRHPARPSATRPAPTTPRSAPSSACSGAEEIGITLTESCAMMPAASVSGLYFAHPEARYFTVGPHRARPGARTTRARRHDAAARGRALAGPEPGLRAGGLGAWPRHGCGPCSSTRWAP